MPAKNLDTAIPVAGVWTALSDLGGATTTPVTVQVKGSSPVIFQVTSTTTPPSNVFTSGPIFHYRDGIQNLNLTELFPSVVGAGYLWGYVERGSSNVWVNHA